MNATTKFSFELPNDEKDLIDIANLLVKKAKKFKTYKTQTNRDKINERLNFIANHRHKLSGDFSEKDYDDYRTVKYGK
ncbi:MAG: hypothetical protein MR902_01770 [Campylobacter sp.]|nr:hypothetical protein [Campylobacter sp.]